MKSLQNFLVNKKVSQKSCLINIKDIEKFDANNPIIYNGVKIRFSTYHTPEIKDNFKNYKYKIELFNSLANFIDDVKLTDNYYFKFYGPDYDKDEFIPVFELRKKIMNGATVVKNKDAGYCDFDVNKKKMLYVSPDEDFKTFEINKIKQYINKL